MRLILFLALLCPLALPTAAPADNVNVTDSFVYGTFAVPSGRNDHYRLTRARVGFTAEQTLEPGEITNSATVSVDLAGEVAPWELYASMEKNGVLLAAGQFRPLVNLPFPGPQDLQTPRLPAGMERFTATPVGIRIGYATDSFTGILANVEEGRFTGAFAIRDTLCGDHATTLGAFAEQKVGAGILAGVSLYSWVNPTVGVIRIQENNPRVRQTHAFLENYIRVWDGGRLYGRLETGRGDGIDERGLVGFSQEWKERSFARVFYNTGSETTSADFTVSF